MLGRFWAVGVGPGDPALLTVKAVNVLRSVQRIYHAGPGDHEGRALQIVSGLLPAEARVAALLTVSMTEAGAIPDRGAYRPGVERIAADCRSGLDVAFITEGDPSLYSTAANVWELLGELYPNVPVEIVPGITAVTAAAARAGWPLARHEQTLRIVPAAQHAQDLHGLLALDPHVCLLKPGPVLPLLIDFLEEQGPTCEAVYIEELGTEREWLTRDLGAAVGRNKYFSIVLLRRTALWQARLPKPQAPRPGQPGKVWVVGIGPGDPSLLTRQALRVLHAADDVIGYDGYLKQLEGLGLRGRFRAHPIGAEVQRARLALDLARAGREVAVVSSGDAGVFGMASVLLETADARAVEIEVVPGVTAAAAAAAQLGAPLGHDFACISLSDLLTPWSVIEARLEAAGRGDFVVALYNPASRERIWQLPRARDILLKHRPAGTPVGLVSRAYRDRMTVQVTTLEALTAASVTMETMVIVGSRHTRQIGDRLVTPRGYVAAAAPPPATARPATGGAGPRILEESFAAIERELGPHALPPWAFAVARRMIHASADFDFAGSLRCSPDFDAAIRLALQDHLPIVTDTEMVLQGIRTALMDLPGTTLACYLNDPEASTLASDGLTRSAAGIRLAARRHGRLVLAIGNAPTALEEALRLVQQEGWRPAAMIGIPVGFVGVEEAKRHLQEQTLVPYLTCVGRKGGSAVTAAAVNALVEFFGR
jgi:precorrin-2 C(20)-methyltransferase